MSDLITLAGSLVRRARPALFPNPHATMPIVTSPIWVTCAGRGLHTVACERVSALVGWSSRIRRWTELNLMSRSLDKA